MSSNMESKNIDIEIMYKPDIDKIKEKKSFLIKFYRKNEDKEKIRIFGEYFVKNNKDKCKVIYKEKENELKEFFEDISTNYNHKDDIILKLRIKDIITDVSYMFYECDSLLLFPNKPNGLSFLVGSNVIEMRNMFSGCKSLISLPDVSRWNTSNIHNMTFMFRGCESLQSLPDISKWNTSNVTKMKSVFSCCESLIYLPEISKWNTSNVKDMSYIFYGCNSLLSLPDISKWETSKVKDMNNLFSNCYSLVSLPEISKWNTSKVKFMNESFSECLNCLNKP